MGSVGNPNPWAPYDNSYKDCSQGICSLYCPQWCYIVFPPPPPSFGSMNDDGGTNFSPLIIAVIGILASAFLLVSYYTLISKYCRRSRGDDHNPTVELDENRNQMNQEAWQVAPTGLDEALIKSIAVCKYKKGDGLVEGTDCSVCLSEFQEDESLRLLPNCYHAFHLPCIDMWLKSHSSCPLCRSNVASSTDPLPSPAPLNSQTPLTFNISSLEIQLGNDALLVVNDLDQLGHQEEVVVSIVSEVIPKNHFPAIDQAMENSDQERDNIIEIKQEGLQPFRRSVSLDSHILIADILRTDEDEDDYQMENHPFHMGIGSSRRVGEEEHGKSNNKNGVLDLVRSPIAMKRSISTGRFMFTKHDHKGKNSIIPN